MNGWSTPNSVHKDVSARVAQIAFLPRFQRHARNSA